MAGPATKLALVTDTAEEGENPILQPKFKLDFSIGSKVSEDDVIIGRPDDEDMGEN